MNQGTLSDSEGRPFRVYERGSSIFLERVTRSGRRSTKSIFEFDAEDLFSALGMLGTVSELRRAA